MSNPPWGPPPPYRPPAEPPRPSLRGLIVGLSLGLVVVLVGTIAVVSLLSRPPRSTAAPTPGGTTVAGPPAAASASSTPSLSGTPAPDPSTGPPSNRPASTQPTSSARPPTAPRRPPGTTTKHTAKKPSRPDTGLSDNRLYGIGLSGQSRCTAKVRRPDPPIRNSRLAPYLRTVVHCLTDAFRGPLASKGFTLANPRVKTYKDSISTPCGTLTSTSNPAFYCAGTIFWPVDSDDGDDAYTIARLGYVGLAAHEYGHHIQASTGILSAYSVRYAQASRKERYVLSRRLELQAQCFEGVFLARDATSLHLGSRDRRELRAWHSYTGDEDPPATRHPDHGSSKAQYGWLVRGLDGAKFGRCNTWAAPKKQVT